MTKTVLLLFFLSFFIACQKSLHPANYPEKEHESGAGLAMDYWSFARSYPDGQLHNDRFVAAFDQQKKQLSTRNAINLPAWKALGPKNIGGRTLALAFHPTNPNIIFAGSASGGLWKSTTAGIGKQAWQRVDLGFPVLGVSSIAIASDGLTMFIGTGEVYGYRNVGTGYALRLQRGTYGIGILKSTDGGVTWTKSLDWSYADLRGVQDIVINPKNKNCIYAATTEGVYKSLNGGATWTNINPRLMAVDIDMHPTDTARLFVSFGSLNNTDVGIFRTNNGGTSWTKLTNGLPPTYSGKTMIDISPSHPNLMLASVANAEQQIGLYKSVDGGNNWFTLNTSDVAAYQGWFSHDVAFYPSNPNHIFHVGVDAFCSDDGGLNFGQISYWYKWYFGRPPVGGPEGPSDYVHADIHGIAFSPHDSRQVWLYTDGGIYVSRDTGRTFEGRNGGYQCTQFYANFSNSQQDSLFAVGGMQDNSTALYDGQDAWVRVIGGDGMCTAIHPLNDSIVFGSYQYLNILRSTDRGRNFTSVSMSSQAGDRSFNGPYEIAPSAPDTMYAGAQRLMRSTNGGRTFLATSADFVDNGNQILTIAVAPTNPRLVYFSTLPYATNSVKIFRSTDAGQTRTAMTGLPNRIATDIVFQPKNNNVVYATFSGFGTPHLYRTTDGGATWQAHGTGLPDVPTNTIAIDPTYSEIMYIGNDLGVYYSRDTGHTWLPFNQALPSACLAMHLSISPVNRKLRLATHGLGVYECNLLRPADFYTRIDSVRAAIQFETKTNVPPVVSFDLKTNPQQQTVANMSGTAVALGLPASLPYPTSAPPQYPMPNGTALSNDAILYPYKLSVSKTDGSPVAGVTTFDIALISKHILGNQSLPSPYRILAGDVNKSGDLDAADMLILRRMILRLDNAFQFVPSWTFIPTTFTMPAEPMLDNIPQAYYINPFSSNNPARFNFIAIKMGDVNDSYLSGFQTNDERNESVVLASDDVILEKGKTYDIPITLKKAMQLMGCQGTITADARSVALLDISSEALKGFSNAHFNIDKNTLVFSWHHMTDVTINDNQSIFTIKIKALENTPLSKALALTAGVVPIEVFNEKDMAIGKPRSAKWLIQPKVTKNVLLYNQPNPFKDETSVVFNLATEGVVRFTLWDKTGRLLFEQKQSYPVGQHRLTLQAQTKNWTNGTYILKMTTQQGTETLRLQFIR